MDPFKALTRHTIHCNFIIIKCHHISNSNMKLLDIKLSFRKYDKKNHLNTLIGTLIVHSEKAHGK